MKNDKMKFQYRVNEQIHAREVRVVNEGNAEVMSTRQALDIARKEGVEPSRNIPERTTTSLPYHRLF